MKKKKMPGAASGYVAPCISVVDDDESIREALRSLLMSAGFRVEVFASAEDILDSGRLHDTQCVIADVRMPGMSGLEFQSKLPDDLKVPIIFITAYDDGNVRAQALQAGAVDFLLKPFSVDALLGAIRSALELGHVNTN